MLYVTMWEIQQEFSRDAVCVTHCPCGDVWSTAQQRHMTTLRLHLLWRAVSGIQYGLIRDVVCATAQVCTGSQINQLEPLLILCKDDIHGLDVSVYKPGCMEGLHSIRSVKEVWHMSASTMITLHNRISTVYSP